MAKTMTCKCGQVLDIEDFAPGDQVECPGCSEALTVPRAADPQEPVMAMAVAVDDEDEDEGDAAGARGTAKQLLTPLERRRRVQMRADYAAQAKLKRVMIWPCLVMGLAALVVALLGFYWAFMVEPTISVQKDDKGVAHLYANVEKEPGSGEYERVEVKPDVIPCDKVSYDAEGNASYTLNGQERQPMAGGAMRVMLDGRLVAVIQGGFWFYEIDPETRQVVKELDLPLAGRPKGADDYVLVRRDGNEFYNRTGKSRVDVTYYKIEGSFATEAFGKFKYSGPPMGINPQFFIWAGIPIGILLLLAGGFFAYETYFSKAAKAAAEKKREEEAAKQDAAPQAE